MKKLIEDRFFSVSFAILLGMGLLYYSGAYRAISPLENYSENQFIQSKTFGDFRINLLYKSSKTLAIEQGKKSGKDEIDLDLLEKDLNNYSGYSMQLENLKGQGMLKKIAKSEGEYQNLIQYLSFDIQKDIFLCTETDTIKCAFTHFERNFDLAPNAKIEIGFSKKELTQSLCENDYWILLFNADHFGLGPLKFRFDADAVCE